MIALLERESFLRTLDELFSQSAAGRGQIVLISGEAGIGKTALVECFLTRHPSRMRVLWGACEALFTPRPLGPLYDRAYQTHGPLQTLLADVGNRAALFAAVLEELAAGAVPTTVVIEDAHWADEATLDLLKFLARRIHRTRILLLVTYRAEEINREHPLRLVLGDLPAQDVTRLRVPPLSEDAVTTLARQARRPAEHLHAVTGGNPFFLREVLRHDGPGVPMSVSDAVLARVAGRSSEAQRLLELVAVMPSRTAWETVEAVSPATSPGLAECLETGLLHQEGATVGYRHELARQAVERALTPARRRALHADVLRVLLERRIEQTPLAQLVYHAAQAEDGALVLRFAPAAAREAAAQGAHRAAADHYRRALGYAQLLEAEGQQELQAALLDGLAQECSLTGQTGEALQMRLTALALWQRLDRPERVGHTLQRLSELCWRLGQSREADRYALEAVDLLEKLPPSRELGRAYASLSSQYMVAADTPQALLWGRRALEVARQFCDAQTECYALFSMGSSSFGLDDEEGRATLEQSLQMARAQGFEEIVALAYTCSAQTRIQTRAYAQAIRYLEESLTYCRERDLDAFSVALRGHRARVRLDQGEWAEAGEEATAALSMPGLSLSNRFPALLALGLVRVRRGDPGAEAVLDEVRALAMAFDQMQFTAPVAAARAEWWWLQGNREQCVAEATGGFQVALPYQRPWYLGEVAIWLWRGGGLSDMLEGTVAPPFAAEMAGDWSAAAALWAELGCPYEQALALAEGDLAAQRCALAILERLGARPAAEIVRRRLSRAGARGLPRGPRQATQANPYQFTPRQLEILLLLAEGLHNPEIAERLSTTPKTVGHHVSAVLTKLDARTRVEAVRIAAHEGLLPHPLTSPPHHSRE